MNKPLQVLTLIAVLGVSGTANAAPWTQVLYGMQNYDSQSGNTIVPDTTTTSFTGQQITTGAQTLGNISAFASATPGILKANIWSAASVGSLPDTAVSNIADSHARAAFSDSITINASNPALVGQTVTVNGSLLLDGGMLTIWNVFNNRYAPDHIFASTSINVAGDGVSYVSSGCSWVGPVTGCDRHGYYGGLPVNESSPAPTVIPVSFTATLGFERGIQYSMELQGRSWASFDAYECGSTGPCGAQASAELTAAYANSLVWGGISSITDANGVPITGFTVSSASGFNYSVAAVPVPAAAWLFGSGLLGLIGFARRRRTS